MLLSVVNLLFLNLNGIKWMLTFILKVYCEICVVRTKVKKMYIMDMDDFNNCGKVFHMIL